MLHSQRRKNLTISTTVHNYRMISEAQTAKRVLFTCPSETILWQLTGIGEDIEDFLGRKLSELDSSFLCGQCWDILLGLHEIGLAKRDIEDFLGRKLSELDSSFLCGQCWDILLGLHEIGLAKRDIPGTFNSPWKWAISYQWCYGAFLGSRRLFGLARSAMGTLACWEVFPG